MSDVGKRTASSGARFSLTAVLAVLLPLLTLGALLLVRPHEAPETRQAPTRTVLSSATAVCPSALPGAAPVHVAAPGGDDGAVTAAAGDEDGTPVAVDGDRVATVDPGPGPIALKATGGLAPGLVASRFGGRQLAAVSCPATAPDQWFTGAAAGGEHTSVLELVNPDAGPAVADVTVYGRAGILDVPRLRGVTVPGRSSVSLDLARVVPRRDELALHVVVARGRLASSVLDRVDRLGSRGTSEDWLPAQAEPATDQVLLGLPGGPGGRMLVLANGGADEVRATVKIVSGESVFAPEGLDEIRIAPDSARHVSLGPVLARAIAQGATGIQIQATGPVAATLRSVVGGDLSHATGLAPVTSRALAVIPEGKARVVLAGATEAGTATVSAWTADGKQLKTSKVELGPGHSTTVDVPRGAALVLVEPTRTPVVGAVVVTGAGAAVVPLHEQVRNGLVPAVGPGLP